VTTPEDPALPDSAFRPLPPRTGTPRGQAKVWGLLILSVLLLWGAFFLSPGVGDGLLAGAALVAAYFGGLLDGRDRR
jgi:hypothetical protein